MPPQPNEIYQAKIRIGFSDDLRPCVVIDPPFLGRLTVSPLSAQMDLYDPRKDFLLDSNHDDFPTTGLAKTCYAIGRFIEIDERKLGRYRGRIAGQLASDFAEWLG